MMLKISPLLLLGLAMSAMVVESQKTKVEFKKAKSITTTQGKVVTHRSLEDSLASVYLDADGETSFKPLPSASQQDKATVTITPGKIIAHRSLEDSATVYLGAAGKTAFEAQSALKCSYGITEETFSSGNFNFNGFEVTSTEKAIEDSKYKDRVTSTNNIEWVFDNLNYAFGGIWDLSDGGQGTGIKITITVIDISGTIIEVEIAPTTVNSFFGLITDSPFTNVTLSRGVTTNPDARESFTLDGLEYCTPPPSTPAPTPASTSSCQCIEWNDNQRCGPSTGESKTSCDSSPEYTCGFNTNYDKAKTAVCIQHKDHYHSECKPNKYVKGLGPGDEYDKDRTIVQCGCCEGFEPLKTFGPEQVDEADLDLYADLALGPGGPGKKGGSSQDMYEPEKWCNAPVCDPAGPLPVCETSDKGKLKFTMCVDDGIVEPYEICEDNFYRDDDSDVILTCGECPESAT